MALALAGRGREHAVSALGLLLVVALLWAPFGLKTTDIADGWINLPKVEQERFLEEPDSARPLVYLPWEIGHALSPDSFLGVGLVLAALFLGKGVSLYALVRRARLAGPAVAFLVAVLFILHPADTGNFLMRALGRHAAVFFFFLAVYLLVVAGGSSRAIALPAMAAAQGVSALIAEQGFPPMAFAPALLLLERGGPKRRKLAAAAVWYAVLALAVVNFLAGRKGHQMKMLEGGLSADKAEFLREVVLSNLVALWRVLAGGWLTAAERLGEFGARFGLHALAVALVALVALGLLARGEHAHGEGLARGRAVAAAVAGLAIIALSFFPYSLTDGRYEDSRTFYYAAAGGALLMGTAIAAVSRRLGCSGRPAFLLLGGLAVFLAAVNGFAQRAQLEAQSLEQQRVLVTIAEQAPLITKRTMVVLLSGERDVFTTLDYVFRRALHWTYGRRDFNARVCSDRKSCEGRVDLARSLLFRYVPGQGAVLLTQVPPEMRGPGSEAYRPYERIGGYVPLPRRARIGYDVAPSPARVWPAGWTGAAAGLADRRVCNLAHGGDCSLLFGGDPRAAFSQSIPLPRAGLRHLELSLWGRAERGGGASRPLATVTLAYGDGSREDFVLSGGLSGGWSEQRLTLEAAGPIAGAALRLHPRAGAGRVWLDDVRMSADGAPLAVANGSFEQ